MKKIHRMRSGASKREVQQWTMRRRSFSGYWGELGGICGTRQRNNNEITMKG